MTYLSNLANKDCEECGGEGYICVAVRDDSKDIPCQKCFPPQKGCLETTWDDLVDYDDRDE